MNKEQIITLILSTYEIGAHAIRTEKNYSILNAIGIGLKFLSSIFNRKKTSVILVLAFGLGLASCASLKKIECVSSRTIPVTYCTQDGFCYTINVPFCDTVKIKTVQQGVKRDTLKLK